MPACPRCQTPYDSGARFCQQCGAFLLAEEPTGVGGTEAESEPVSPRPPPPYRGRNPRFLALLGGLGIVLLVLASFFLTRDSALPPVSPPPAPEAALPAGEGLQLELAQLLSSLREAQVNQDIVLFMGCYAQDFPGREEKRQKALKAWEAFDFAAMFFYLEEVQPEGPEAVQAKVTWDLQVRDKLSGEFITAIQVYRVKFVREQGAWRIRGLEEISAH